MAVNFVGQLKQFLQNRRERRVGLFSQLTHFMIITLELLRFCLI